MKKYTTPGVEVIKFQIEENIANETGTGPNMSGGVGSNNPFPQS